MVTLISAHGEDIAGTSENIQATAASISAGTITVSGTLANVQAPATAARGKPGSTDVEGIKEAHSTREICASITVAGLPL